jgi:hypothetical protein
MKRKWILVVCALGLLLTRPAHALFGVVVFDPTNYAQALDRYYQLQQQFAQLVQTYQMIRSQYDQMLWMAKQVPVNMAARYRALYTPWLNSSAANTYGTAGGWTTGINTGIGVESGYSAATQPLGTYGASLGNIPADQLPRVKTNYATVELADGANLNAMETIGRLRANAPAAELAIQNLENDSLSSNPDMNTEIAVLNKINAADLIACATHRTPTSFWWLWRNSKSSMPNAPATLKQAINDHIRFMAEGQAVMAAQGAGASEAMLAWRMP